MSVVFLLPGTDVADIAAAVRAELAVELSRIDAPVSSRATPEDVADGGPGTTPDVYSGSLI